jgi:chromosome segregation ATPase
MQPNLNYDRAALKDDCVRRHGHDIGQIVFDSKVQQRQTQDAQCAELGAELTTLNNQMSELRSAAGQRQLKLQARLEAVFAEYRALCEEAATAYTVAEAEIAPLQTRSLDIQRQISTMMRPRSTEIELRAVAYFNSSGAELLRTHAKVMPPLAPPPLSALAEINLNAGKKSRF